MLEPFTEEAIRFCLRFQSQHALSVLFPIRKHDLYTTEAVSIIPRRYRECVPSCSIDQVAN